MSKYCHDDSIHNCLIECEECPAYYDDKLDNYLITEKDFRDSIEEKIRADERKKVLEEIKHKAQSLICPEYDERYEFFNDGVQLVLDIIEDYEKKINLR